MLSDDERRVIDLLGEAATRFAALPPEHEADLPEFVQAIHAAQNIVFARPAVREYWERYA